jgi:hypothetical protein
MHVLGHSTARRPKACTTFTVRQFLPVFLRRCLRRSGLDNPRELRFSEQYHPIRFVKPDLGPSDDPRRARLQSISSERICAFHRERKRRIGQRLGNVFRMPAVATSCRCSKPCKRSSLIPQVPATDESTPGLLADCVQVPITLTHSREPSCTTHKSLYSK